MNKTTREEYVEMVNKWFKVPQKITNEWLDEIYACKKEIQDEDIGELVKHFGVSFRDISGCDLSELDEAHYLGLVFNSSTIFPEKGRMPKGYKPNELIKQGKDPMLGIKKLHDQGIDGRGVVLATIDFGFQSQDHIEYKGSDIQVVDLFGDTGCHFHADGVLSNLCGQNIGVAPKAKVYHYCTYQGIDDKVDEATMQIFKDILAKIKAGEKIRAVNVSAPISRCAGYNNCKTDEEFQKLNQERSEFFQPIIDQLKENGCEVIHSKRFGEDFHCCDYNPITREISKTSFATRMPDKYYQQKVSFICAGKVIPEFTSNEGYQYQTESCFSWTIPQAVGMYALCLQQNPSLSWEEFTSMCHKTSKIENGVCLAQPDKIIQEVVRQKNSEGEQ